VAGDLKKGLFSGLGSGSYQWLSLRGFLGPKKGQKWPFLGQKWAKIGQNPAKTRPKSARIGEFWPKPAKKGQKWGKIPETVVFWPKTTYRGGGLSKTPILGGHPVCDIPPLFDIFVIRRLRGVVWWWDLALSNWRKRQLGAYGVGFGGGGAPPSRWCSHQTRRRRGLMSLCMVFGCGIGFLVVFCRLLCTYWRKSRFFRRFSTFFWKKVEKRRKKSYICTTFFQKILKNL